MLYHFSENPDITTFVPQPVKNRPDLPSVVWAIDEEHAVNYYFPRDCPRVIYSRSEAVSSADLELFFHGSKASTIIVVESGWLEKINTVALYRYTFEDNGFELTDGTAGYYLSRQTVNPIAVEPVQQLLAKIVNAGAELRFTPNLYPIRNAVLSSTIDDYSIIRFQHAVPGG
ncbi:DUF6886 family protein [Paenibacillus nasutitermitis]|uniref:Uncharacterized protein n=1 Tax=Paenibacillus nasutitermitis TaxID=1652958 RepID=A0A916YRU0_9BACL|nr:DUF6886 family protein [Paenibacillus nasutitermitis]GGD57762.1 hypothetical protein GCM10010911_14440 [Paenibacillus nasutitermitis]